MMRTVRLLAASGLTLVGCSREAAPVPNAREPERAPARDVTTATSPGPSSIPKPEPVSSSAVAPPGTAIPAAPTPVQLTELAPTQGDLTPLLVAQSARARAKGLITLVEFYADWCPPCRAFQKSLDDAAMKDALQGVYLIKLNLDDWHDKLDGTGYVTHTIPSFFRVGADGRPVGKMLDGDKWRRPTPAAMAASIKSFLAAPE